MLDLYEMFTSQNSTFSNNFDKAFESCKYQNNIK